MEGFLRQIIVPENTMSKFLALASKNTANNVETCGILAGRLAYNRLNITHVIVPKQQGTPDSCTTMNEEDIFEIQDQHNLITLGWIHVSVPVSQKSVQIRLHALLFRSLYHFRLIQVKQHFYHQLICIHIVLIK